MIRRASANIALCQPGAGLSTEREKWEAATAHIRLRYPSITWREPLTPCQSLGRLLERLKLETPK